MTPTLRILDVNTGAIRYDGSDPVAAAAVLKQLAANNVLAVMLRLQENRDHSTSVFVKAQTYASAQVAA